MTPRAEVRLKTKEKWLWFALVPLLVVVLGTAATWEAGKEWAWYTPLAELVRTILGFLGFQPALPVWGLALSHALVLAVAWWFYRKPMPTGKVSASLPLDIELNQKPVLQELQKPRELDETEEIVLESLFIADGEWMSAEELAKPLRMRVLVTEDALKSITLLGYAKDRHNAVYGTDYRLDRKGIQYAREKGWDQKHKPR